MFFIGLGLVKASDVSGFFVFLSLKTEADTELSYLLVPGVSHLEVSTKHVEVGGNRSRTANALHFHSHVP